MYATLRTYKAIRKRTLFFGHIRKGEALNNIMVRKDHQRTVLREAERNDIWMIWSKMEAHHW